MEDKNIDNIYIYTEDSLPEGHEEENACEDNSLDSSGPNYSQAENCGEGESPEDNISYQTGPSPFMLMLKVMLNPVEGWKSVRRTSLSPERAQQGCFYPMLAIMAMSKFLLMIYNHAMKLQHVLVEAVCSFVSFFFGYFCILIVLKIIMPRETRKTFESDFGKVFVIISLSTLCLFNTFADALPMLWALLIFLPLWTIYLICRGMKFLKLPQNKQILLTFILCIVIVGMPGILTWILESVLPS